MIVTEIVVLLLGEAATLGLSFFSGTRYGRRRTPLEEAIRIQLRANMAQRQLHDLTRAAFVAMAEHAEAHGAGVNALGEV